MDTNHANNKKFPNHTNWNLGETSIENQVLHDSIPFTTSSPFPSYPFQHHHHHQIPTPAITEEFDCHDDQEPEEELGAMKEMMYRIAAMQPVDIDPATILKPKRRNVRISDDPQSVAARHRRERISEKIRILQRLVPGGTKMDTASMLDEAIRYVKFLKRQIRLLQCSNNNNPPALAAPSNVGEHDWHAAYNNPNSGNFGEPLCFNDHEVINQSVINGMK